MRFTSAAEAARAYVSMGIAPVAIEAGAKAPKRQGWQNTRLSPGDVDVHFNGYGNVGLITGAPSGHLHDVDLDCPEAVFLASLLLPETGMISGRKKRPSSHYWFRSEGLPYKKYNDPIAAGKLACLVEVRGGEGHQTVVEPSTHPEDGDVYEWIALDRPAEIPQEKLAKYAAELAACCLLARYYPPHGTRHEAVLAMAGHLVRGGRRPEFVADFLRAAASCHDALNPSGEPAASKEAFHDIEGAARDTARRIAQGKPATGGTRASEFWDRRVVAKISEWLGMRGDGLLALVKENAEAVAASPSTVVVTAPEEIPWSDVPPPPPEPRPALLEEAMHGLAGRYVDTVSPHTEADPIGILASFLAAFSISVGRGPHMRVGGAYHYTNLFVTLVGGTASGRKGTATTEALRPFVLAGEQYIPPKAGGLSSGEGFVYRIRDARVVRRKTKQPDGTILEEEVEEDPGVDDKRLLVVESEMASVLQRMKREGNTISALVREAWDGNELSILTKTPVRCNRPHVGLITHITDTELASLLAGVDRSNGFANRMIFFWVQRPHLLPMGGCDLRDEHLSGIAAELGQRIASAKTVSEMVRTPPADELWRDVYGKLSGGSDALSELTARAPQHVMRLSMNYALLDGSPVVDVEHLAAAIGLWQASEASVRTIFTRSNPGAPSTKETGNEIADELLRELREAPLGLTKGQIRDHFPRHINPAVLRAACDLLVDRGLVGHQRSIINGRAAERWVAKVQVQS